MTGASGTYGPGAGVWTRDGSRAFRVGRAIKAGRVWTAATTTTLGALLLG
jgi:acyl-CoA reductase-like NAD-dependent aldehyde dehydrogenase